MRRARSTSKECVSFKHFMSNSHFLLQSPEFLYNALPGSFHPSYNPLFPVVEPSMIPTSFSNFVFVPPPCRLPFIQSSTLSPARNSKLSIRHIFNPFLPPPLRASLSGALAETLVHLVLYPLDTLKTHRHFAPACKSSRLLPFAGAPIGLLGVALDAAVFSLVYHTFQKLTQPHLPKTPSSLISAAISSLVSTAFDSPFTLARDRIRLGLASSWRDAWKTASTVSWRGLYAGARETVFRDVPAEAIEFATYETLKRASANVKTIRHIDMLALGMITGAITGAIISPLDLVVTKCVADPVKYKGVLTTVANVVNEAGVAGVFAGAKHKILREMASSALFFCVFDSLRGEDE